MTRFGVPAPLPPAPRRTLGAPMPETLLGHRMKEMARAEGHVPAMPGAPAAKQEAYRIAAQARAQAVAAVLAEGLPLTVNAMVARLGGGEDPIRAVLEALVAEGSARREVTQVGRRVTVRYALGEAEGQRRRA